VGHDHLRGQLLRLVKVVLRRSCPVTTVVPEIIGTRIPKPVAVRMSRWPATVASEGMTPPLRDARIQ